jgi:glycosyltransferase involved in cell wall biosynthesis
MDKVTAVITSYNRFDLLQKTVDSLEKYFKGEIIIIEDSANPEMWEKIDSKYAHHTLIFNAQNLGLIQSIDRAYSYVETPYVFHSEDDYLFLKDGFIEKSVEVLDSDPMINMVWIKGLEEAKRTRYPLSELKMAGNTPYHIVLPKSNMPNHGWKGFCFQCGLRRMVAYQKVAPYDSLISQWTDENGKVWGGTHITNREKACDAAYHKLGYKSAILTEKYAEHLGYGRSTYNLKNR